jgi:hypothetical protein
MKTIGTVLPTAKSLKATKAYAKNLKNEQDKVAKELKGLRKVNEDGETRFYKGDNVYAVIGRDLKIKWFEKRADGHWWAVR